MFTHSMVARVPKYIELTYAAQFMLFTSYYSRWSVRRPCFYLLFFVTVVVRLSLPHARSASEVSHGQDVLGGLDPLVFVVLLYNRGTELECNCAE
jgi:hypothetical protein